MGSLPTEFLPSRCIESLEAAPKHSLVKGACEQEVPVAYRYINFQELKRDFTKIKHPGLIVSQTEQSVLIVLLKGKRYLYDIKRYNIQYLWMSPLNSQFIVVTENCLLITLCTRSTKEMFKNTASSSCCMICVLYPFVMVLLMMM